MNNHSNIAKGDSTMIYENPQRYKNGDYIY